jgi:hypothetical protein
MAQPATELDLSDNSYDSVDKDWVRTRAAVGELVSAVLSQAEPKIPFELREELWKVIYQLTNDPNPTEAYEARYGGSNMDPLTLSLNTIRGTAFHTLFKYLNWCRKQLNVEEGFEATPEVREVLEQHVDFEADKSLAVRGVYGERLPWLATIAPDWVTEYFDKLFPNGQNHSNFRKSVWETFINYTQPYDSVFEVLRNEYGNAIERLGEESLYKSEKSANHLAEHLNVLYIRGKIGLGDGGLIDAFYARASDNLSAHVFWFAGRMLRESILPPEMEERLSKLVEHRISNGAAHPREMESFGSIFVTEKLDAMWSLQRLRESLEISPTSEPDHMVIETLSKLAPDHPQVVLDNTSRLVDGADAAWKLQYWSPHLRSIIQTASQNGAAEQADALINKLAGKNLHGFRDLLSGGQKE